MKIQVLGSQAGTQAIIEMGIMQSPVLAVDGKPVMTGFVSDIEKIKKFIKGTK